MLQTDDLKRVFDRDFEDIGDDYVGCCPIHEEKTPSFYVHKEKLLVHCFGCGAHGQLIDFVSSYLNVDEQTARKLLRLTLYDSVCDLFVRYLPKPQPKIYPESYLAPFRKEIHKYVIRRGLTKDTLKAAGSVFDASKRRQVFPHRKDDGRLCGAIGRACKGQEPKWYFYWGYEKGRYLYRAPGIDSLRPVWVVEGVFDALWLYQKGYNAVATLGSHPTGYQIDELVDSFSSLIIAYDNDAAGIEGAKYLHSKVSIPCLFPRWPKNINDIMEVEPQTLRLENAIQREFIHTSNRRSRLSSKQEESSALT